MDTPVTTIDICLGANASDANAHVLATVTDEHHADAILTALADAQHAGALFQSEGLVPFTRAVDRS